MSSSTLRRTIPLLILSLSALLMIADYFIPFKIIDDSANTVLGWSSIAVAFSLGLGIINMSKLHLNIVLKREQGKWPFSLYLICLIFVVAIISLIPPIGANQYIFWVNQVPRLAISGAVSGMVGLFVASTAYRSFRARNIESVILLISSSLVMLYFAPIGKAIWPGLPILGQWFLDVPNRATQITIMITGSLGLIQLALRLILGRERTLVTGTTEGES